MTVFTRAARHRTARPLVLYLAVALAITLAGLALGRDPQLEEEIALLSARRGVRRPPRLARAFAITPQDGSATVVRKTGGRPNGVRGDRIA